MNIYQIQISGWFNNYLHLNSAFVLQVFTAYLLSAKYQWKQDIPSLSHVIMNTIIQTMWSTCVKETLGWAAHMKLKQTGQIIQESLQSLMTKPEGSWLWQ